ncbi:hypothetical protein P7C71_g1463, partial [Lecanoromycetidae sp. Uapishka_2]
MDDLSSVEWTAPKAPSASHPQGTGNYSNFPSLRPTPPISGRSTPSNVLSGQRVPPSPGFPRSNASTPANDSFANLVAFNAGQSQSSKNLSLQEQQRLRQGAVTKEEAEKRRAFDAHFGAAGTTKAAAWDTLGDGRTTPNRITSPPTYTATDEYGGQRLSKIINKPFAGIPRGDAGKRIEDTENDLLAAFNAEAPVDKSSHMEPASRVMSNESTGQHQFGGETSSNMKTRINEGGNNNLDDVDDDPFGLGMNGYEHAPEYKSVANGAEDDDDDVLGLLGRPVSEFPKPQPSEKKASETAPTESIGKGIHPQERAVSELVDMGFSAEKSKRALEATESGIDVQSAVGWLLNQAHEESRRATRPQRQDDNQKIASKAQQSKRAPGRRKSSTSNVPKPAWMREQELSDADRSRSDKKSPVNGERDPAQYASELGNKVFKTAGSLWKTGAKKLNQAVSEFNSDSDSNQPKWMKETQADVGPRKPRTVDRGSDAKDQDKMKQATRPKAKASVPEVTDEALMLEGAGRPPPRRPRQKPEAQRQDQDSSRDQSPAFPRRPPEPVMPQPRSLQQVPSRDPRAKLSRQAVEEETSQAYISPARRKKTIPRPQPAEPEPDLLFSDSQPSPRPSTTAPPSHPTPGSRPRTAPTTSLPARPAVPKRDVPSLSSFAQQASTASRQAGSEAFKRGDYGQATAYYSTSLSALPPTHPLTIPILTNRALSHSKTGDSKASVADAISALNLIGPSRGASETIDLGPSEGVKQMSNYWEKAMLRQAEALEQLERWSEAAAIWRTCVEAGVGGATSAAGRNRCEKAANPQNSTTAPKKPTVRQRPKPSALGDMAPDSESVSRLRAANAAADKLDDEKFALADVVDGRVSRWRAGKEGNLRALLSTLENVLWEGSGWKKVGMGDVLLPGKVKLVYMKGIAKVHPDKLPTTATTEQKMISASVFATLNEAWERFKAENGL